MQKKLQKGGTFSGFFPASFGAKYFLKPLYCGFLGYFSQKPQIFKKSRFLTFSKNAVENDPFLELLV